MMGWVNPFVISIVVYMGKANNGATIMMSR